MHPGMRSGGSRAAVQGRRIWSCGPCMILLFLSVVLPPTGVTAIFQGSGKRDTVHRVFKVKVTEDVRVLSSPSPSPPPLSDHAALAKRAGSVCPASYSLCASSLGGDCCPENYACAQSSCYATTAAVSTCQGQTGYFACPFSLQGGCCPQGLACASDGCTAPAGATYAQTCPTGYFLCPSSMNYGCCATGMGCAVSSCYSTSPSTTTITYTTTDTAGHSVVTVTTTSVTTPTSSPSSVSSSSGDGAVAKFFPSTEPKLAASKGTGGSSSSGGHGGLSKGAIGGIVAGAAVVLVAVLVAAFLIIRQLKRTEKVVQSHRETTSGGTRPPRRDAEKRSESHVRVEPTPTEVDNLEDDPLMINNTTNHSMSSAHASPGRRAHPQQQHQLYRMGGGRSRSGSDAASQPSVWSGPSAGMRNTPSLASDVGDGGGRGYFELPPREHDRPGGGGGGGNQHGPPVRHSMASTMDSSAQYSYHNFVYAPAYGQHGRHPSEASELSAGASDDFAPPPRGPGSPPDRQPTFELGVDGEWRPELPGSDTDNDSNNGQRSPRRHRRRQSSATAPSINNVVSPMSATTVNRPPLAHATRPRRRGTSNASSLDGQNNNNNNNHPGAGGAEMAASGLGSIDESSTTGTRSLHGHYGPPVTGPAGVPDMDLAAMPGFVPLESHVELRPSQDESERW